MKPIFSLLLVASLALNAVLAFFVVRAAAIPDQSPAPIAVIAAGSTPTRSADPLVPADEALPSLQDKDKNLPNLIAELRAAGFPKDTIRAIISALLSEQFDAQRKALDPEGDKRPFWKDRGPDPKYQMAQTQLWREQQKALRGLIGPDADESDPLALARQRQQFGNLAPEKMSEARDLVREFDDKRQDIYASGVYSTSERDKIAELDKQQRAALAQILSPAELEEYDLRSSSTGRSLRTELAAFNPTEEEFRAIFKLRQPYDEQRNRAYDTGLPSQEQMAQQSAVQKALNDQIKATLGPIRGTDYEIATDYNYRRVSQVVARLELPAETTKQLWDAQKDFQQRATDIRRATSDQQDRVTQLTSLQQEATAKLGTMLGGARGLEAYKQYGGAWLQNLVPRPPSPPKN